MHELSIAQGIVTSVLSHLPAGTGEPVARVKVKVGGGSRMAPESLRFCFAAASRGTQVQGAALEIEETAGYEIVLVEFDLQEGGVP